MKVLLIIPIALLFIGCGDMTGKEIREKIDECHENNLSYEVDRRQNEFGRYYHIRCIAPTNKER